MPAAQDPNFVMLIILIIGVAMVFFWRTAIKLVAVGTAFLIMLGFLDLLRSLH